MLIVLPLIRIVLARRSTKAIREKRRIYMNQFEIRMRVQSMVDEQVMRFIEVNHVSPSIVEDAINKVLVKVKDMAYQEFLTSITVNPDKTEGQESAPQEEDGGE